MASVTAEVMLEFGLDINSNADIVKLINALRFDAGIEDSAAIINLLEPLYDLAHKRGVDSERGACW